VREGFGFTRIALRIVTAIIEIVEDRRSRGFPTESSTRPDSRQYHFSCPRPPGPLAPWLGLAWDWTFFHQLL